MLLPGNRNPEMYYGILKINVFRDTPGSRALFLYNFISQGKDKEKVPKI